MRSPSWMFFVRCLLLYYIPVSSRDAQTCRLFISRQEGTSRSSPLLESSSFISKSREEHPVWLTYRETANLVANSDFSFQLKCSLITACMHREGKVLFSLLPTANIRCVTRFTKGILGIEIAVRRNERIVGKQPFEKKRIITNKSEGGRVFVQTNKLFLRKREGEQEPSPFVLTRNQPFTRDLGSCLGLRDRR